MVGELYTYQMEGYKRIVLYLAIKQKGLCHLCNQQIRKLSPIAKNMVNHRATTMFGVPKDTSALIESLS
jgi:hypothetical protein